MTHTSSKKEKPDLTHLTDYRAVLRWSYDHGQLRGEFPSSRAASKVQLLNWGEKRLRQLIKSELTQALKELKEELNGGRTFTNASVISETIDNKIKELEGL